MSDFPAAFIARIKGKAYIAQQATPRSPLQLLFALVKSVTQAADRTVLPDDTAIAKRASSSVSALVRRVAADPSTVDQPDTPTDH